MYVTVSPRDPEDLQHAIERIQNCINIIDIKACMITNFLNLNDEKTEIIVISRKDLSDIIKDIKVGDASIDVSQSAKNLGVVFGKCFEHE